MAVHAALAAVTDRSVTAATAPDFLAFPNVACVGCSWLTPADAVARGDWARITTLARQAAALRPAGP